MYIGICLFVIDIFYGLLFSTILGGSTSSIPRRYKPNLGFKYLNVGSHMET